MAFLSFTKVIAVAPVALAFMWSSKLQLKGTRGERWVRFTQIHTTWIYVAEGFLGHRMPSKRLQSRKRGICCCLCLQLSRAKGITPSRLVLSPSLIESLVFPARRLTGGQGLEVGPVPTAGRSLDSTRKFKLAI